MRIQRGSVLTETFGAKIEVLSHVHKDGTATIKVLNSGSMLEARPGTVIKGFALIYGCLLRFSD
ncbi:hypothetical protein VPHD239_0113 [Vibrio phage D239]